MRRLRFVLLMACVCAVGAPVCAATIQAPVAQTVAAGGAATVAFLVRGGSRQPEDARIDLECTGGRVDASQARAALEPGGWRVVTARVSLDPAADCADVVARCGASAARTRVMRGVDLARLPWRRQYVAGSLAGTPDLSAPELDDTRWASLRLPAQWKDLGVTWCRTRFTIPASWRGRRLTLRMGAIDDADATYLNGVEIGRTNGWDTPRRYAVPNAAVRWGAENVLAIAVDNVNAGGGPNKPPLLLVAGDAALADAPAQAAPLPRPAPGPVGSPHPLRPMHVDRGVLRYPDGSEVALWGANTYPQSWHQFVNMKRLGVDMRATIRRDLDDMQRMGVQVVRIHVFDREISDGAGRLIRNEHLDLLDCVVAECSRRGLYLVLTPIAWWGGPNELPGAFSQVSSKPGMMFSPTARHAAAAYLRAFLTHRVAGTGRALVNEPCLCLLEVQNEPAYFEVADIAGSAYEPQGDWGEALARDHAELRRQWNAWLAEQGLPDDPALYPVFRYGQMRRYVREMVAAIRSTGARQPVAISGFAATAGDIVQAIADSECDAVTTSQYPGGWERVNDGANLLPLMAPADLPAAWSGKARIAYEFDAPATNVSCYLYPAIAAFFRRQEVQIACQFQYDSIATAKWNLDWLPHWLNWLYTPGKAVSFAAGGIAFSALPRGVRYAAPRTELVVGAMAASFARNNCMATGDGSVAIARSTGAWDPVRLPAAPRRLVATGSNRWVDYGGAGAYVLERTGARTMRLTVNPDATLVGNSLAGAGASPAAGLSSRAHLLRLRAPGWAHARCAVLPGRRAVPRCGGGWLLTPGRYEIAR